MPLNNMVMEIGKTSVNTLKLEHQRVRFVYLTFYCRISGKHCFIFKRFAEAKDEYIARYLDGNIGKFTWPSIETYSPNLTDHTTPDHGPLSPDLTSRLPPLDITPEEATQLGYMPQRDDFERDYNHEAESLVSSLFLNPAEDDDLDIALKLAQVDMYTNNLRERARRKRVVRDYQLVSAFFSTSRKEKGVKKKQTKEEKYASSHTFIIVLAQYLKLNQFSSKRKY